MAAHNLSDSVPSRKVRSAHGYVRPKWRNRAAARAVAPVAEAMERRVLLSNAWRQSVRRLG